MTSTNAYALVCALSEIPADRRWELLRTVDSRGYGYTCRIYRVRDARLVAGVGQHSEAAGAVRVALEQMREFGL